MSAPPEHRCKTLNKTLANRIHQHKKYMHHDQMGYIQGLKDLFTIIKVNVMCPIETISLKHDDLNRDIKDT